MKKQSRKLRWAFGAGVHDKIAAKRYGEQSSDAIHIQLSDQEQKRLIEELEHQRKKAAIRWKFLV